MLHCLKTFDVKQIHAHGRLPVIAQLTRPGFRRNDCVTTTHYPWELRETVEPRRPRKILGAVAMITVPELAADALGRFLGKYMRGRFGSSQTHLVEMVPSIARIAIECIGNSDALYHNVEHTMLVTLAGHDILRGRALHNHMPAEDYAHVIIACLTHDIGYVRGLFKETTRTAISSILPAARSRCRADRPTQHCCLTMSTVPRCSSWSGSKASQCWTSGALRAPSRGRGFPPAFPARMRSSTRRPRCCGQPT